MNDSSTRPSTRRRLAATAAIGAIALSVAMPGTAVAQPLPGSTTNVSLGQSISLGRGNSFLCGGFFFGGVTEYTPPGPSGRAAFGVGFTPYFDGTCTVDMVVTWRNLDTGATGTANRSITTTKRTPPFPASLFTGPTIDSTDGEIDLATGPGRVNFTVSTTSLNIPLQNRIYQVR